MALSCRALLRAPILVPGGVIKRLKQTRRSVSIRCHVTKARFTTETSSLVVTWNGTQEYG
eukprot:1506902-Rhodomonas_salina.6